MFDKPWHLMTDAERQRVADAWHESGHATVAKHLGLVVNTVHIRRQDRHYAGWTGIDDFRDADNRIKCIVGLAGAAAIALKMPAGWPAGDRGDLWKSTVYARRALRASGQKVTKATVENYLDHCRQEATRILRENAAEHDGLCLMLLKHTGARMKDVTK